MRDPVLDMLVNSPSAADVAPADADAHEALADDIIIPQSNGHEAVDDPLTDLIRRAAIDPGAPFEKDALAMLLELKAADQAQFERTWAKLKAAGTRMGPLQALLKSEAAPEYAESVGLLLSEIEPWPDHVGGAALLNEIASEVRAYVAVGQYCAKAIALWVLHAHAHDAAQISPRLAVLSPEKRCGKTTLLGVIQEMVPRALPAANITGPSLFRVIEAAHPTLLIDEADTFLKNSVDIRGILNSGHSRRTAIVIRTVGDDHEPKAFSTWAPVAIAMIGRLPETLMDRSIVIEMRRRKPGEHLKRFRADRVEALQSLARKAARWAVDNMNCIRLWDGDAPPGLHDRAADNWRVLLAIADTAGGDWPERAKAAALGLSATSEDDSVGALLLGDIQEALAASGRDRMATAEILQHLNAKDERRWSEWRNGHPMTAPQLARLLRPFKVHPGTIREAGETFKGYRRSAFADAFSRYLGDLAVTPSQPTGTLAFLANFAVTSVSVVTAENSQKPKQAATCDGVTAKKAPAEEIAPLGSVNTCDHCGGPCTEAAELLRFAAYGVEGWLHRECERPWLAHGPTPAHDGPDSSARPASALTTTNEALRADSPACPAQH
jgi:hypothetical protein